MAAVKGSKLLRGNWVELQAIEHLDDGIDDGNATCVRVSKEGHRGLITNETDSKETVSSTKGYFRVVI